MSEHLSFIETKVKMLDELYYLVETNSMYHFKNLRKYVININELMEKIEYDVYRSFIDKMTSAAILPDYKRLAQARESIGLYQEIANYLKDNKIFYAE